MGGLSAALVTEDSTIYFKDADLPGRHKYLSILCADGVGEVGVGVVRVSFHMQAAGSGLGNTTVTILSLAPDTDLGIFQNSAWPSPANAGTNQQC